MEIDNIGPRIVLIRLITIALTLLYLLGMPTLVTAEPPTPEERLARIEGIVEQILQRLGEINNHTHARLGDLRDSIDANREEISRLRSESTLHFITLVGMLFLWPPIILALVGLYMKRKP